MLRLFLAAPAIAFATLAAQPSASARDDGDGGTIRWRFVSADGDQGVPQVHISRRGMQMSLDAADAPEAIEPLAQQARGPENAYVRFTLVREAGALACEGRVSGPGTAEGDCRFAPAAPFTEGLNRRGVELESADDLLGLTLADARLASIDEFARAGLPIADSDGLVLVSALHVTPAYRDELRAAGLEFDELEDLATAEATGIDVAWLSAMAGAGYPLRDADQAIEMRALGITPEYARRMERVLRDAGEE